MLLLLEDHLPNFIFTMSNDISILLPQYINLEESILSKSLYAAISGSELFLKINLKLAKPQNQ